MIRHIAREPAKLVGRRAQLSYLATNEEFFAKPWPAADSTSTTKISTAANGPALLTVDNSAAVTNLKFAVMGGSSAETGAQRGASQLLAAAAFSGNGKNSGIRIVRFLESLGANFRCIADREKIVYDVDVLPDRVEPVVGMILSCLASPPHAPYVFEEARSTAKLDLERRMSCPVYQISELTLEAAFGEDSPLGGSLFGRVGSIGVDRTMEYRSAHFVQENIVIAGSGISHDRLKSIVDLHVKKVPTGALAKHRESKYIGGDFKVRADTNGATRMAIAFPVMNAGNASSVLLDVLKSALAAKKVDAAANLNVFSNGTGLLSIRTTGSAADATANLRAAVAGLKSLTSTHDFSSSRKKVAVENFSSFQADPASGLLMAHMHKTDVASLLDTRTVSDKVIQDLAIQMLNSTPTYVVHGATSGAPLTAKQLLA